MGPALFNTEDPLRVHPIPCLRDNYAYLIICPESGDAAVVDPSEAAPVLAEIEALSLNLKAILNTHHHWDHVGGNEALCKHYPNLDVYGYHTDRGRIPGQNRFLKDGDTVTFGSLKGRFTHNPGHTTGAVTYYFEDAAFTGDTLFAAGCGRLFEGSADDMWRSLNQVIGSHDESTKLYFGHEYTASNLRFALTVEPDNQAAAAKLERVLALRDAGQYTTPSTITEEKATNPFMRCDSETIRGHLSEKGFPTGNAIEVLAGVRTLKDQF